MRKGLTVLAVVVVLGIIVGGILQWIGSQDNPPTPPPTDGPTTQAQQPDWCPNVEVVAAPGTWESASTDDQFKNINSQQEITYDESRTEGTTRAQEEMTKTHNECPLTDFILVGFSQGAVIMGDIANAIGQGTGPIPADRVRGVALVADGRREPGVGQQAGNPVAGVGAEVSLAAVNALVQPIVPGATMRGPRPGGFGSLNDRTFEICAADDHICDAPLGVGAAFERAQALVAATGVHSQYATNPNVFPGSTTTEWLIKWANGLINQQ